MGTSKIGRRGPLTLPRDVREAMKLAEGDRMALVQIHGEIVGKPLTETQLDRRGRVRSDEPLDPDKIR